jgi:HSP20 family molecular chaperone IbpA
MADDTTLTKPETEETTSAEGTRCGCYYRPNVDILEKQDELVVLADLPGASSDGIGVDFEEGTLTISARVEPRNPPETEYLFHEYGVGNYYRTFQVSEAIDSERITAEYADGVLSLRLPKSEAAKPRKIAVQGG